MNLQVEQLIAEHFGLDTVNEQDHIVEDLGGDDLDVIELVMLLEETFNITIDDEEAYNIQTVQDVNECLRRKNVNV